MLYAALLKYQKPKSWRMLKIATEGKQALPCKWHGRSDSEVFNSRNQSKIENRKTTAPKKP